MKVRLRPRNRSGGFSMTELLVVVAIMLIIAALAFPTITETLGIIRSRGAMGEISGIVQNCRSLAVRRSKTKIVHVATLSGRTVLFTQDCRSITGCAANIDGIIQGEDEILYLPPGFTAVDGGSAPGTLDPATIWGNTTTEPTNQDIAFTPRGLPCDSSSYPCAGPRGFIKYFSYAPPGDHIYWIALTVSPAGRIKNYYWNSSSNSWGS